MEQVKFTEMKYGDVEDYQFLHGEELKYVAGTGERLLDALLAL